MSAPPTMSQFADRVSCLEARDRYWQEENAKLREQLAVANAGTDLIRENLNGWKERAEAAEAKLKALDEQEPIGYVAHQVLINLANGVRYGGARITPRVDEEDECIAAIYAKPVPPVDVQQISGMSLAMGIASTVGDRIAELERDMKVARGQYQGACDVIKQLERRLAEQQALLDYLPTHKGGGEELNTLLAQAREEGRKEAIPDALTQVLTAVFREIEFKDDYNDGNAPGHAHDIPGVWDDDNGNLSGTECAWCKLWNTAKAMLSAAPSPASLNAKEGEA